MGIETKPLAEVTYVDLAEFLELRIPEGQRLDYKEQWEEDVVKHVTALADIQWATYSSGQVDWSYGEPIITSETENLAFVTHI